tara:strand:- start:663 stop:890 length:228 start_codon:yes stop_codon:yes gene_type:complete
MSSYTQSGNLRRQLIPTEDETTLRQMDNALGRWIKRFDASKCPRCGTPIKPNSGLHCSVCFGIWQEEFGTPFSPL